MNWGLITDEWRLKVLALGLAVLLLEVVGFALTQPTTGTLDVGLNYVVTSPDIILLNPPTKTTVTYTGLAEAVQKVNSSNLLATVDTTGAKPGTAVKLNVTAKSLVPGVLPQPPPPIAVNIDTRQLILLRVQVVAVAASGWEIDTTKTTVSCPGAQYANPCQVQFDGPVSWESGLKAVVALRGLVGKNDILGQAVQIQPSANVDLTQRTVPLVRIDVTQADVHIEAVTGATQRSVPLLDSPPIHPPPQGYRVTAITITPPQVTITGDASILARIQNLVLSAVDLSRNTSDATFQIAISYPNGVVGDVQVASVKYSISPNPSVSPSPGP